MVTMGLGVTFVAKQGRISTQRLQRRGYRAKRLSEQPHPALGVPLVHMGELAWPRNIAAQARVAKTFREHFVTPRVALPGCEPEHSWDLSRPCVIRGFARDWEYVRAGRLDPETDTLWRRALADESCVCEFQPGQSHMRYEHVEGMDPSLRLVNPAALLFKFPDFLDACHMKRRSEGQQDHRAAQAATQPIRRVTAANVVYEESCWKDDPRYLPVFPRAVNLDITEACEHFSLYCAQHDLQHWPEELLRTIVPCNPFDKLLPSWPSDAPTVNTWMCGGGPGKQPVSCNFHCDFSENLHVVLSGRKEVFMCHPTDIAVLHGTSYCAQAAWGIDDGWPLSQMAPGLSELGDTCAVRGPRVHRQELIRDNLRTPMCVVNMDASFEENCAMCPGLQRAATQWRLEHATRGHGASHVARERGRDPQVQAKQPAEEWEEQLSDSAWHPSGPIWAELCAGDVVYIPPGWFHFVRTWHPTAEERGLPFSLSVNFWRNCCEEMWEKEKLFRLLEVSSIRQALVGDRNQLLQNFFAQFQEAPSHGGEAKVHC